MSDKINSTSDDRIVNNVMRHNYRVLTDNEKFNMQRIKDTGLDFIDLLYKVGNPKLDDNGLPMPPEGTSFASRELSIAAGKIEEAVMWAVKHVTK